MKRFVIEYANYKFSALEKAGTPYGDDRYSKIDRVCRYYQAGMITIDEAMKSLIEIEI